MNSLRNPSQSLLVGKQRFLLAHKGTETSHVQVGLKEKDKLEKQTAIPFVKEL